MVMILGREQLFRLSHFGSPTVLFFKDQPDVPKPVDPYVQAAAQTGLNKSTALFNAGLGRVNQYTPYGSMTYDVRDGKKTFDETGFNAAQSNFEQGLSSAAPVRDAFMTEGAPSVESRIDFTPEGRQMFDQQNRVSSQLGQTSETLAGKASAAVAKDFNFDRAPSLQTGIDKSGLQDVSYQRGDYAPQRQQVIDGLYGDATARLDPRFAREQKGLETQLTNQGITRDSEAWKGAADQFSANKNDAYRGALASALAAGGQEQSRLAGLDSQDLQNRVGLRSNQVQERTQDLGLNNLGRQRSIEEQTFLRDRPMNELNSFRSGVQLQGPNFSGPVIPQGTGAANIGNGFAQQYQGQMAGYNAEVAGNNALTNGLFSLGSAAMGMPSFGGLFGLGKK
jgi:hypothetical protein